MDSDTKAVYHGAKVIDSPPYASNPPPGQPGLDLTSPTVTVMVAKVGPQPSTMVCRSCNAEVVTRVELKPSTRTHLFALGLCLVGCWCCVCIPYCTDSCKSTNHYCPNCNAYIGAYKN